MWRLCVARCVHTFHNLLTYGRTCRPVANSGYWRPSFLQLPYTRDRMWNVNSCWIQTEIKFNFYPGIAISTLLSALHHWLATIPCQIMRNSRKYCWRSKSSEKLYCGDRLLLTTLHGVISQKTHIFSLTMIHVTHPSWRNHDWNTGLHSPICLVHPLLSTC